MNRVSITKLINALSLVNLTPEINTDEIWLYQPEINRPALQLAGFMEHFENERVQIIGYVEYTYTMDHLTKEERLKTYEAIFRKGLPAVIYSRDLRPEDEVLALAVRYNVPILGSKANTSDVMAETIRWLRVELAPQITIHGVLVDVYGTGVLITGESGIGKSEVALELIKRGHRLVADDVVEVKKVSDVTLVGSAPEMTRYLIEIRGIGIVDVKSLFGVSCVRLTNSIDVVIHLEEWDRNKEYDRMGLEDHYTEYMGIKVVSYNLPVRPGRNLAVVVESTAVNHRQKSLGYNAAKELYRRVQENLTAHRDR